MFASSQYSPICLLGILALGLSACGPQTPDEKADAETAVRSAVTPAPTPTPKPGAWMYEKRENALGIKNDALKATPKK
jgi:hypothetical protein